MVGSDTGTTCPVCGSVPFIENRRVYFPQIVDLGNGRYKCNVCKTRWTGPLWKNYDILDRLEPSPQFIEQFLDTNFQGTTIGTWNTTAQTLTLADATQYASSTKVWNNGKPRSVTMTVTSTGTLGLLYVSADNGTTWETVTNGVSHTFTTISNAGIRWKAYGGAGGCVITKVQLDILA